MIITRTPLRISLGGGGTDLPSYYRASPSGGFLVAGAIDKYVYIAINRYFGTDLLLKYSSIERVTKPEEVEHPLLREALMVSGVTGGVEISSMADIPAGTGLGSSGAFTVGLLKALTAQRRHPSSNTEIAELACHVEIDRLQAPVGKQDQYIAAVGGITAFEYGSDDTVKVRPVQIPEEARLELEENLLLFYTGISRPAAAELRSQDPGSATRGGDIMENLDRVKELGYESHAALEAGDMRRFGALLTDQWKLKLDRAPSELHREIDNWLGRGIEAGAVGGKLVGAGGGGFVLFYAEAKVQLRAAMKELGLEEVKFGFDYDGVLTIVNL